MRPAFEKLIPPSGSSIRCFNRATIDSPAAWHYHPELELNYISRGSGTRFVGDSVAQYGPNELVLVGSNVPHHWASDQFRGQAFDRHPAIVVQFPASVVPSPMLALPEMESVKGLIERSRRGLAFSGPTQRAAAAVLTRMLAESPFDRFISLLKCLQLLAAAPDAVPLASERYSPGFRRQSQTRLHRVCQFINERLTDPSLCQSQVAEFANMNPAAFSRFFKSVTQRTVTEYINELRIGLASRLLLETDRSTLDISLAVGFQTYSNFNRRFQQFKKMGPREYRRACRLNMASAIA